MAFASPLNAPEHITKLLQSLHKKSLDEEAILSPDRENGKIFSADIMKQISALKKTNPEEAEAQFDAIMRDKFIALDEDKCLFVYQTILASGALNVVEAGTSFGVSTIYLAMGVQEVEKRQGQKGKVVATEKEETKSTIARGYWRDCANGIEDVIELRQGDLLATLKVDLPPQIDLLLLDIWSPLALPTLKIVEKHFRPGAVVITDNITSGVDGYKDLIQYFQDRSRGYKNTTLPYTNGLLLSVYSPESA